MESDFAKISREGLASLKADKSMITKAISTIPERPIMNWNNIPNFKEFFTIMK